LNWISVHFCRLKPAIDPSGHTIRLTAKMRLLIKILGPSASDSSMGLMVSRSASVVICPVPNLERLPRECSWANSSLPRASVRRRSALKQGEKRGAAIPGPSQLSAGRGREVGRSHLQKWPGRQGNSHEGLLRLLGFRQSAPAIERMSYGRGAHHCTKKNIRPSTNAAEPKLPAGQGRSQALATNLPG